MNREEMLRRLKAGEDPLELSREELLEIIKNYTELKQKYSVKKDSE